MLPVKLAGQLQVLLATQVPPFLQEGEHVKVGAVLITLMIPNKLTTI